jgi:hypothetical protein
MNLVDFISDRKVFLESKEDDPKWEGLGLSESMSWDEIISFVPESVLQSEFSSEEFSRILRLVRSLPVISKYKFKEDLQTVMCEFREIGTLAIVNYLFSVVSFRVVSKH